MSLAGNISNLARLPSASSEGYGNVDGPASATANAIARFNGTTGKIIKNSAVTIDDAGAITAASLSTGSGAISGGAISGTTLLIGASNTSTGGVVELKGSDYQLFVKTDNTHRGTIKTDGSNVQIGAVDNMPVQIIVNNSDVGLYTSTGLNNTVIGATTPAAGSFTTLSAYNSAGYGNITSDGTSGGAFNIKKAGVAYAAIYGNETNTVIDSAGSPNLLLQTGGATRGTFSSTGLAVTGTVSTTDPAGGAGPAWKLGVAAVVSPTSPNRTIRIDIGGTSYYLAAKTTND